MSTDRPPPRASLILPAFNEAGALPSVIAGAREVDDLEVIVVDDGSTDDTSDVARAAGALVVRLETNRGKGAAMVTGAEHATTDRLVFMDADGTYPADAIPALVGLLDDHEVVRGVRRLDHSNTPTVNRMGAKLFDGVLGRFHGLEGADHLSGLYAIRRHEFLDMGIESRGFDVEVEIGIKSKLRGLDTATLPIRYAPRIGDKKLRPVRDGFNILLRVVGMLFLFSPVATFVVPGLVLTVLSLVAAAALSVGPLRVGGVGLSIHSYVLAIFGALAGLQAVIFGIAATLYRSEAGYRTRPWLIALTTRRIRLGAAGLGTGLMILGALRIARIGIGWIADGAGLFLATDELVTAAGVSLLGLELLSAGMFLSIFSSRMRSR